jgi:DNA repair protein RadD
VFDYTILDGIRDGYLCPAFSIGADDKIDPTKLRTRQGEYTAESSDAQMIAAMDNHIAQMVHHGSDRRAWLIFEAGTHSATAMAQRMTEWGIATGLVLGETDAMERRRVIDAFRSGRLRAIVNVNALTTGFDVPAVDLLVMRRPTKSLGLYIQQVGRALRTIGGNIEASIAAGKADCAVLDFAGNIDRHGPLDFIRPKQSKSRLVSCEACGTRNASAARNCWHCGEPMTKLCPACLGIVQKGILDCPHCAYDMRVPEAGGAAAPKLRETPSGAALISSYKSGTAREGGWLPVRLAYEAEGAHVLADTNGDKWTLPPELVSHAAAARWVRGSGGTVEAILLPNGASRSSALQVLATGASLIVPLPAAA